MVNNSLLNQVKRLGKTFKNEITQCFCDELVSVCIKKIEATIP